MLFDRLMLLAKGKIVYFNEAKLAVDYFSNLGEKYQCPEFSNPAEFFIDVFRIESFDKINEHDPNNFKSQD